MRVRQLLRCWSCCQTGASLLWSHLGLTLRDRIQRLNHQVRKSRSRLEFAHLQDLAPVTLGLQDVQHLGGQLRERREITLPGSRNLFPARRERNVVVDVLLRQLGPRSRNLPDISENPLRRPEPVEDSGN